ncbi:hypothetical protein [Nocardia inohanensis]|uniref:hypothetical protein n=1 Tax=Nocardia inohanensis TaxID=209246 RepID=UPI000832894C|nr:hypothetical protein [Nocardia inohanensis]
MTEVLFAIAIAVTVTVALARLTLWSSAPQTRLLTVVLLLLATGAAFVDPRWRDEADAFVRTPGFAGMVADVVLLVAVCLMCAYVARIWDLGWLRRLGLAVAVTGVIALIVTYTFSELSGTHRGYTGELSHPATIFGILISLTAGAVSTALLVTAVLARPVTRTQFWFGGVAVAWLTVCLARLAATIDPDRFADLYWSVRFPGDIAAMLCAAAAGAANLRRKRHSGTLPHA